MGAGHQRKYRACDNARQTGEFLTDEEKEQIIEGLQGIRRDVENGTLPITEEYEDIHSFVEANLIDRIGDAGRNYIPDEAEMIRLLWI